MNDIMLDIRGLKKHFAVPGRFLSRRAGLIQAVDGVDFSLDHNRAVVHIEAPQDKEIAKLGVELNKTYIAYGGEGRRADG